MRDLTMAIGLILSAASLHLINPQTTTTTSNPTTTTVIVRVDADDLARLRQTYHDRELAEKQVEVVEQEKKTVETKLELAKERSLRRAEEMARTWRAICEKYGKKPEAWDLNMVTGQFIELAKKTP